MSAGRSRWDVVCVADWAGMLASMAKNVIFQWFTLLFGASFRRFSVNHL